MGDQKKNITSQTEAVHPGVLRVSGEQTSRWCAAVWSTSPGERRLVGEIHRLVQGTLIAHWMQPPAQYELATQAVNSFDLIFFQPLESPLRDRLKAEGWQPVALELMSNDEFEQFQVLSDEARKKAIDIAGGPTALWRVKFEAVGGDESQGPAKLGAAVAEKLEDQVWGQIPGWFSRVFCDQLRRVTAVEVEPTFEGLAALGRTILGHQDRGIHWLEPMAYQAICDFIGVVVQAETELDVQWGTCPVDQTTGLAPAPMLRVRQGSQPWRNLAVGYDVIEHCCVPWGPKPQTERDGNLEDLARHYARGG